MGRFIGLTGQVYNMLTVIERVENQGEKLRWLCRCKCGNTAIVQGSRLKLGGTKSCGCLNNTASVVNIVGNVYGKLRVIERSENSMSGKLMWLCRCHCGNEKVIYGSSLKSGKSKTCGCSKSTDSLIGRTFGRLTVVKRVDIDKSANHKWLCKCSCGNCKAIEGGSLKKGATKSCGCLSAESRSHHQLKRMPLNAERHIYICRHPTLIHVYKVGIAVNPKYRTGPAKGSLILINAIKTTSGIACRIEEQILDATKHLSVRPVDMVKFGGITEWRKGQEVLEIYNAAIRSIRD